MHFPLQRVNPKLGKPPNSRFVFPHCFSDSFPFSLRTHRTSTLKTGNIHLHKQLLCEAMETTALAPRCAPQPVQAAPCNIAEFRAWIRGFTGCSCWANTDRISSLHCKSIEVL